MAIGCGSPLNFSATAVRRPNGKYTVTVRASTQKMRVGAQGEEQEAPMRDYVDIQGSGVGVTRLTGTANPLVEGAVATVRDLHLHGTGGGGNHDIVRIDGADTRIQDVEFTTASDQVTAVNVMNGASVVMRYCVC